MERAFVINKSSLFRDQLDLSKLDVNDGRLTDDGWVSFPSDLGRLVGEEIGEGDFCVFKFHNSISMKQRDEFEEGLRFELQREGRLDTHLKFLHY